MPLSGGEVRRQALRISFAKRASLHPIPASFARSGSTGPMAMWRADRRAVNSLAYFLASIGPEAGTARPGVRGLIRSASPTGVSRFDLDQCPGCTKRLVSNVPQRGAQPEGPGGELSPSEIVNRTARSPEEQRSAGARPAAELCVRPGGRPQGGGGFGAGRFSFARKRTTQRAGNGPDQPFDQAWFDLRR